MPKKHTTKEIQANIDAATTNLGAGIAGITDRTGQDKGGHAKYECPHCKITTDVKTMQIHHDSKHPKIAFDEAAIVNRHASTSTSQTAPAEEPKPDVQGSLKSMGVKPWDTIDELSKSGKLLEFHSEENFYREQNFTNAYHAYVAIHKENKWGMNEDIIKGGTWVRFETTMTCRNVLSKMKFLEGTTDKTWANDFLCPLIHRSKAGNYLLYPQVFITWDEWQSNLLEELPTNCAELAVSTFCQVLKKVRDMHEAKTDCFSVIKNSIGITRTNKVLFINPPQAGRNFHKNILELSDMAIKLANRLPTVASHLGLMMMVDFHDFIVTNYTDMCKLGNWQNKQLLQPVNPLPTLKAEVLPKSFIRECLALNHPVWYQPFDTHRLFNNLGRLGDKRDPRSLGSNSYFQNVILSRLSQWNAMLSQDQRLKEIMNFTLSTNQIGPVYEAVDILHCFTNAIKHYWERGTIFLSKEQVAMLIEDKLIPQVSCILLRGYGKVVMNGYQHHEYNVESVFYPRKGMFL